MHQPKPSVSMRSSAKTAGVHPSCQQPILTECPHEQRVLDVAAPEDQVEQGLQLV
jgi:hypothetical protein